MSYTVLHVIIILKFNIFLSILQEYTCACRVYLIHVRVDKYFLSSPQKSKSVFKQIIIGLINTHRCRISKNVKFCTIEVVGNIFSAETTESGLDLRKVQSLLTEIDLYST